MKEKKLYLKYNVLLEPLCDQWYAWPHLVAPATAAMHTANSHLKIMKSFVMAPAAHAAAVKNPAMRGGPFMDLDAGRVGEVKSLIERINRERAPLLELAGAIKSLGELLSNEAKGASLEPFYARVPEALKGYVELTYDLNHNASFRLIERLLYKKYYDPSAQSIALSVTNSDERPFVLSTPRFEDKDHLHLDLPFAHAGVDELFKMRYVPQSFGHIKQVLGVSDSQDELFKTFFTEQGPPEHRRFEDEGVRIRYFGHACVLIEARGVSILTDPVISYSYENALSRFTYTDLPDSIDYVVITHAHSDHMLFETLLQLRHKVRNIVVPRSGAGQLADPSLKLILEHAGFKNVVELDEMESIEVEGGSITGLPFLGEHADLAINTKLAYAIRLAGKTIVCAADSSNLSSELYQHLHDEIGDVDALFLGMECDGAPLTWVYGPLLMKSVDRRMDQSRRLSGSDFEQAWEIVNRLRARRVYVYAMGQEPWLNHITSIKYTEESKPIVESNKLLRACAEQAIPVERLYGWKELFL